ncbi:60S ribosomal protein L27, mitochondrial [Basidiobolus ranarum]|uniref:60S ribosomal protein L27, mitochondrial n=1 Tax=Basidiobolus ranarum TaxID=34480 RepID=A0ABR2X2F5_9FUNG
MFGVVRAICRGARRDPMTSKRGHNYYKGKGSGAMGRHTKHGGYLIDYNKVRTYVVPDLADCQFKPYVSHRTEKIATTITAQDFLTSATKTE